MALSKMQFLEVLLISSLVSLGERGDWMGAGVVAVFGGGLYSLLRAVAKNGSAASVQTAART